MKMNKDIIPQGDIAKYQVIITCEDFDQQRDPFRVVIHAGIPDHPVTIDREDMTHDEDGNFFMLVDTAGMVGPMKAYCYYSVPDSDMEGGLREVVDMQWLAFVAVSPCPQLLCCKKCDESDGHVVYKRVWRSDTKSMYLNLKSSEGEPIKTTDGQQLKVRKTEPLN